MNAHRCMALAGLVLGVLLTLAPLVGITLGIEGVFRAFSRPGIGDPRTMAEEIGSSMLFTLGGFVICPLGIALLVVSAFLYSRQSKHPE